MDPAHAFFLLGLLITFHKKQMSKFVLFKYFLRTNFTLLLLTITINTHTIRTTEKKDLMISHLKHVICEKSVFYDLVDIWTLTPDLFLHIFRIQYAEILRLH